MKIQLKNNHVAILREANGDVVGIFRSNNDARQVLERAVAEHFDVVTAGLCDSRDFVQPFDYEQPYKFVLYKGMNEDEFVELTMTFSAIY